MLKHLDKASLQPFNSTSKINRNKSDNDSSNSKKNSSGVLQSANNAPASQQKGRGLSMAGGAQTPVPGDRR
jgi:hypothetical protein